VAGTDRMSLRAILSLTAIAFAFSGCASPATAPMAPAPLSQFAHPRSGASDLYIGNILGGVLLYSTGKGPHQVGDITGQLPRVTSVWVNQSGTLYAFSDNRSDPYETIEEFQPGSNNPSFSLVLKHYGNFAVADAQQNVYAQGEDSTGQQVIDVYPPGSQMYSNEYVVPALSGELSGPESAAFDSTGALLVGVAALVNNHQGQIGAVYRLDTGSGTFVNLNLEKAYGGLIAVDAKGTLFVGGGQIISVYAPGATKPSRFVRTATQIVALTAAPNGTLYVSTYEKGITVYPPGKGHSTNSYNPPAQVSGLALGPG
jgi:hypothetical protein